jgi:hypothetical protein
MSFSPSGKPLSARKEFFGHGAPRSSKIPASDNPSGGAKTTSADKDPALKRPVSKIVLALQPSPGWVQAGSLPTSNVRSRSAGRVRDPAVLKSDGRPQASIHGTPKTSPSTALFSRAVTKIQKMPTKSLKANSEVLPVDGATFSKPRPQLNAFAPTFNPPGVRIPVHLAADCDWSDEQVLAADDLRRSQEVLGQFRSTGSAATGVPSHIPHSQPGEPSSKLPSQIMEESRDAADSTSSRSSSEVPQKQRKKTVAKKPRKLKKTSTEVTTFATDATSEPFSKRPKILWSRDDQTTSKTATPPPSVHVPSTTTFQQLRKSKLDARFVPRKAPRTSQSAGDGGPNSDGNAEADCIVVSDSPPEGPADKLSSCAGCRICHHATSYPTCRYQETQDQAKKSAHPQGDSTADPEDANQGKYLLCLSLRLSTIDGSCLFDSLARSLEHVLKTDFSAFSANSARSAKEAIQALTDRNIMRQMICDHLDGPFADFHLNCLSGQTPRQAVMCDYVQYGQPLYDSDWTPPEGIFPVPIAQEIKNYAQYIRAMRKKGAHGDEICIAACADLLGLRHIIFDTRDSIGEYVLPERLIALSLDLHPEDTGATKIAAEAPIEAQRVLSSRMPLILLRNGLHFDWMHCESDIWNDHSALVLADLIVGETHVQVTEIFNPSGFAGSSRPILNSPAYHATPDQVRRPLPCHAIIQAETHRRMRREVVLHLIQDIAVTAENAEAVVSFYEQDTGFQANGRHASIRCLPILKKLCVALNKDVDPLCNCKIGEGAECHCSSRLATAHQIPAPHSKFIHRAAERRTIPWRGPQPDRIAPEERATFTERIQAPSAASNPLSDFDNAVQALMACGNISSKRSREVMSRHVEGHAGSLLGAPLRAAFLEIRESEATKKTAPTAAPTAALPTHGSIFNAANTLSDTRAEFISHHLGHGTRAMTAQEVANACKDQGREEFTGCPSAIVPKNLEKYWTLHKSHMLASPRGNQPHAEYQSRLAKQSYDALHRDACTAASLAFQAQQANSKLASPTVPEFAAPNSDFINMNATDFLNPNPGGWQQRQPSAGTPASASHPVVLESLKPPIYLDAALQRAAQVTAAPIMPTAAYTDQNDHRPIDKYHQLQAPTQPHHATRHPPSLHPHPSPQVRLAQDRERAISSATAGSANQINITVDTGILPSNSVIWKAGKEADGAGFNYHAYSGVKSSWEQANADKTKGYRTIKSFIDPRFIGTICDYISVARTRYDSIPDSELFRLLEEKLRPTDSTIYFMKVGRIKISTNPADGTLSDRYSVFAEAFLATVNEATEAGTPLRSEAVKYAFRAACNSNGLLRMWLGAEEWTTVQAAHQRIYSELQKHENHQLCENLSGTPIQTTGNAPAIPAPLAHPPPVQYTPEQKREYALAKQQRLFASQHQQQLLQQQREQQLHQQQLHQQQVLANSVQQHVDLAFNARLNQVPSVVVSSLPAFANSAFQFPRPSPQPQAQPAALHPGLDTRGPFWHVHGPALSCRSNPCASLSFCQGCGTHGHTSADCRRRNHPGWNASGYYCDRYPGNGPLPYATPKPLAPQYQFPQPPAQPSPAAQSAAISQFRVAPPPVSTSLPNANPFPTPFKVNNVTRTHVSAPPCAQVNASTQLSPTPHAQPSTAPEGGQ